MTYHPDRNPNNPEAEDKFKRNYRSVCDSRVDGEKRSLYDRFGHAGVGGSSGGPAGFDPAIFQDFGDIFGDIFGFGDMFGQARTASAAVPSAGPIFAKTYIWNLMKRSLGQIRK